MNQSHAWGGWLAAALLTLAGPAGAQPAHPGNSTVPPASLRAALPFTLPDQLGTNHTLSLPLPRLTLLTVADKQGADEVAGWVNPVQVLYTNRVNIVGVANVSAAPRWLRGQVRRQFRHTYAHPVLLDWEGRVATALAAAQQPITVLLAAPDGTVLYRQTGPATAPEMERLLRLMESHLK